MSVGLIIILGNFVGLVLFLLGWWTAKRSVIPIENNNAQIRNEKEEIKQQISLLQEEYKKQNYDLSQLKQDIKEEEQKKALLDCELELKQSQKREVQEFIEQSEQLAKDRAQAVYEKDLSELLNQNQILKKDLQLTIDQNINKIEEQKNELKSLQETRAAAIKAAQREKEIQENKENYCLILSPQDQRDVALLKELQYKVLKTRAITTCIWSNYYLPVAKEKIPKILGKVTVCGIYKITNQKTGQCYIGQAVDVKKRIYEHMRAACGVDTPLGNQLYAAMQEDGIDNFSIELLTECLPQELNEKEKYFIELYQSQIYGYNMNSGTSKNKNK